MDGTDGMEAMLDAIATSLENSRAHTRANAAAAAAATTTTTTTTGSSQQEPVTNDDSDARMCVVCTADVALDDVCWIEAKCEPHSHFYHVDCLALWWFETNRRPCPRCTQQVNHFEIHARPVTGNAVTRRFRALPWASGELTDQLTLVGQSDDFRSIVSPDSSTLEGSDGTESIYTRIDAWDALVGWIAHLWRGKLGEMAVEGIARVRAMEVGWVRAGNRRSDDMRRALNPEPLDDDDTLAGDNVIVDRWTVADLLRMQHDIALSEREDVSDHGTEVGTATMPMGPFTWGLP